MAWLSKDVAASGEYLQGVLTGGAWIDPFGSVNITGMMERLTQYADGWTPLHIEWVHGLFGFGESLKVYGRAVSPVATAAVSAQIVAALNSFWAIAGSDVQVTVSDSVSTVIPSASDSWSGTVQLVAFAVIAVAIVWGLKESKEIFQ